MDFSDDPFGGLLPQSGSCPLCGRRLTATLQWQQEQSVDRVMSSRGRAGMLPGGIEVEVTWLCENGCQVTCKGDGAHVHFREPRKTRARAKPLTDDERRQVDAALQRGKEALDEIVGDE